ncbi:MAG: hypothetical protein AAB510_00015 [Patescibacteria group bacterium]
MKRIGVLRGGGGKYYYPSLKKGGEILAYIQEDLGHIYKTFDILIDRDHVWYFNGLPINPSDLIHRVDVVWNTTHPSLSSILEGLSIPHISTGTFSSTLENSREMLREHMKKIDVHIPRYIVVPVYQKDFDGNIDEYAIKKAKEVFNKFSAPWLVKSFTPDANMAIHIAKTFPELISAIEDGAKHKKSILVEEFITGKVASVHSVPNFRNEKVYIFPLGYSFGSFSLLEKERLMNLVRDLHDHIGAKHYLKSDFVIHPRGKVYLLGINETPSFKIGSHLREVCDLVGAKPQHILEHMLKEVL